METVIKDKYRVRNKNHELKLIHSFTKNEKEIAEAQKIQQELEEFILRENHPCLMARSVIDSGRFAFGLYQAIGSQKSAPGIHYDLCQFVEKNYQADSKNFFSFIAVFKDSEVLSEKQFEARLWQQLQHLYEEDAPLYDWDPKVSPDPNDPQFSFSLFGRAFFIVGLHPGSSRLARKFAYPAIVFNLHEQFEVLRKMERFDLVRDKIRSRDQQLQGSINPMLNDYGSISEARQYSGRKVKDNWKCPFHK